MSCPAPEILAANLDGELTRNETQQVTAHIAGCSDCRRLDKRLSTLVRRLGDGFVSADGRFTAEVMARVRSSQSPRPTWSPAFAWGAGLALVLWVVVSVRPSLGPPDGPVARGGGRPSLEAKVGAEIFVQGVVAKRLLEGGMSLSPTDGLSFVLYNRSGAARRFALFGIDARSDVHWFYPAYRTASEDPETAVAPASPQVQALEEGVSLNDVPRGSLTLVALFDERSHRVREIEDVLKRGGLPQLREAVPGAALQIIQVEVR